MRERGIDRKIFSFWSIFFPVKCGKLENFKNPVKVPRFLQFLWQIPGFSTFFRIFKIFVKFFETLPDPRISQYWICISVSHKYFSSEIPWSEIWNFRIRELCVLNLIPGNNLNHMKLHKKYVFDPHKIFLKKILEILKCKKKYHGL